MSDMLRLAAMGASPSVSASAPSARPGDIGRDEEVLPPEAQPDSSLPPTLLPPTLPSPSAYEATGMAVLSDAPPMLSLYALRR